MNVEIFNTYVNFFSRLNGLEMVNRNLSLSESGQWDRCLSTPKRSEKKKITQK